MRFLQCALPVLFCCGLVCFGLLAACGDRAQPAATVDSFLEMSREVGTVHLEVRVRAPAAVAHAKDVTAALDEMQRIVELTSPSGESSELARLNAEAGAERVAVSRDLYDVVSLAMDFARRSGGAYEPTGDAKAGARAVELHPPARAVRLREKGMRLDLGGVAHGFAAQAGWAVLGSRGVKRFLVRVGDVAVAGEAPADDVAGWALRIDKDVEVLLTGRALATFAGGRSAAVIAGDGPTAAALAQALTRMPWKDGVALATSANGAEARIVAGEGPAETLGFRDFVRPPQDAPPEDDSSR